MVRTTPSKHMQQSDCRWVLAAAGKREFGLCAVAGGMTVIALVACIMMQVCCETAAELKVK